MDLAQLVERGSEEPVDLVRLRESTLDGIALVVQSAERHVANVEAAGSSPARRIFWFYVAVITQPAECQSSKLERWVRIPLTAFGVPLAVIAQRVEQPPRKRQVAGSTPARGFCSAGFQPALAD